MRYSLTDQDGHFERIGRDEIDDVTGVTGLGRLLTAFHAPKENRTTCPACNWTLEDAKRTTLMGCPVCYTVLYSAFRHFQEKESQSAEKLEH
ncbi:hypothetical protein QPK87_05330 [Kamptonema cortianum]|nr:hypothetical protein [Geitlerinema splendidum]MDK3155999.1 hypothetical protein [Kamptonema cortianum]